MIPLSVLVFAGVVAAQTPERPTPGPDLGFDFVLEYMRPVLMASGKVARIDFAGPCDPNDRYDLPFPAVQVRPPERFDSGVVAVREIFRDNDDVQVSESPDGVIRVTIGPVRGTILETRIPNLTLTPDEQYTELIALYRIRHSAAVREAKKGLGFDDVTDGGMFHSFGRHPEPGEPHLPPQLDAVSMDEAITTVASTFKAIVMYGECASPARFEVTYYFIPHSAH